MKRTIKSIIAMVALAIIMFGQMAVCVGSDFAGPITILSPTNGETWVLNGEQKTIRWLYPPGTMGKNARVSVTLLSHPPSGNPSWDIYKDAGFDTIIPSSLTAEVPWTWENFDGAPTAGAYHIGVSVDLSPNASDQYKGDVLINLISAGGETPSLTVLSPNGGEVWYIGDTYDIKWQSQGLTNVNVLVNFMNLDNSTGYWLFDVVDVSLGKFSLKLPDYLSLGRYQAAISQVGADIPVYDQSDSFFTITNAQELQLSISQAGAPWSQTAVISWPGEVGGVYLVLFSTNLLDWEETAILETNSFLTSMLEGSGYFRVQKLSPDLIIQSRELGHTTFSVDSVNQTLALFDFTASGKDMKVSGLDAAAIVFGEVNGGIRNAKVLVDGIQVGSTKDLPADSVAANFTFGSSFIVKAGTTAEVRVVGDIKKADGTSYAGGENIIIVLYADSVSVQNMATSSTFSRPQSDVYGDVSYVVESALTVTKYSGFGNQTVVAGASNVRLGSFVALAGAQSINAYSATVTLSPEEAAAVANMRLVDHNTGATLGATKGVIGMVNIYSLPPNIVLGAYASPARTIDLYADVMTGASGIWQAQIDVEGVGVDTGASVSSLPEHQTLQTITIVPAGTLTVANGSSMPDSAILIAGSTGNFVAEHTFSAANEGFTIDRLPLKIQTRFADTTADVVIKYKDKSGISQQAMAAFFLKPGDDAYQVATFTGLDIYVPANERANLKVFVDLVLLPADGYSGVSGAITLLANEGFHAVSDSGTEITSAGPTDLTGNTFYVRKSKLTFAKLDAGTDPDNGPFYRFSVVSDWFGDTEIKQLGFVVNAINCQVKGLYLYDPSSGTQLTETPYGPVLELATGRMIAFLPIGSLIENDGRVLRIGTTPKVLEVRGTVTGFHLGSSLTIGFAQDTVAGTDDSAWAVSTGENYNIWSDRSAVAHTTLTRDWCNGFLLKDMTQIQSFSAP